jgi:hypothetical protein
MHARHSVTSARETEPAGNSEKSRTSRACFAFDAFELLEAPGFAADFDADFAFATPEAFASDAFGEADFLLAAAVFFDAVLFAGDFFELFFDAFGAAGFLPAALFTFGAAIFFAGFLTAGADFFAAAFGLFLVAAI